MKLESVPPSPSQVIVNGMLTKFVRNVTPDHMYQIAKVLGEKDYLLLFSGTRDDGEEYLWEKIEEDCPGLMNQPGP